MKIKNLIAVVFLFAASITVFSQANKHALIIAVGDYPKEGRWGKISSLNDVALIEQALLTQGFEKKNIALLADADATHEGIKNAFTGLENKVKKDDIVVIHFSGHGQQIQDNNNDEIDGYDESIIPYDAHRIFRAGVYEGESHYRDDELGESLASIQKKVGAKGNVLVILDACHSGTGTRGDRVSRGTGEKFQTEGYKPVTSSRGVEEGGFTETSATEGLAPLVLLSGASADQLNYEYRDENGTSYGSLSYAVSKALTKANSTTTYRTLFDAIQREMSIIAPYQMPQIEGQVDQGLFGGEVVEQVPYYLADSWIDENTIKIKSGVLSGLYENSVVGFYPAGTINPENSEPIATGNVTNSKMLECVIKTDNPISKELALESRIFVQQLAMGDMSKKVNIEKLKKYTAVYEALKGLIESNPNIKLSDAQADFYVEYGDKKFQVFSSMDQTIKEIPFSGNIPSGYADSAYSVIKTYIRGEMVRGLEMTDESIDVSFEIIPVNVEYIDGEYKVTDTLSIESMTRGGLPMFSDQQVFKIKVTNNGSRKAFFQILDIKSNLEVDILLPSAEETPAEMNIAAHKSKILPHLFVFQAPFGNEMFKLIATKEPIQLNSIVTTRGKGTRGSVGPLEQLLKDSYPQTRAGTLSVPPKAANIHSVVFKVQP